MHTEAALRNCAKPSDKISAVSGNPDEVRFQATRDRRTVRRQLDNNISAGLQAELYIGLAEEFENAHE
jgi:hypothetical protein